MSTTRPAGVYDRLVAARVRALRKQQGLSVEKVSQLCREAGHSLSRSSLAYRESAHTAFTVEDLGHLAQVLDVKPGFLIDPEGLCLTCLDSPPAGFSCQTCGAASSLMGVNNERPEAPNGQR